VVGKVSDMKLLPTPAPDTVALNIINEYDIIPRADHSYLLSMVDLFRSIYNQNPMSTSEKQSCHTEGCWPLPIPDYYHVGHRIILRNKLRDIPDSDDDDDDEDTLQSQFELTSWLVDEKNFGQLIFCSREAHRRYFYEERIRQLSELYCLKPGQVEAI
jgi:hypothetical protein